VYLKNVGDTGPECPPVAMGLVVSEKLNVELRQLRCFIGVLTLSELFVFEKWMNRLFTFMEVR